VQGPDSRWSQIFPDGPLAWDEIVKGYEYSKGHYVVVTDEDFKHAALESSSSIDILDFVPASEIDPRYFETPYYLVPTKGGEKPYALLREAIRKAAVVGIGKIVMRQKQHLVGVKVVSDALVLEIMRFATELADTDDVRFPGNGGVRPQELQMAEQLVKSLAAGFDPDKYTDEYRANLMKIIHAKMRGKKVPTAKVSRKTTGDVKVIDLMSRLKASLQDTRSMKETPRRTRHTIGPTKVPVRARKGA
jgi:DNA end-binding protein Ku